jgi:hypothetical protein
MKKQFFAFVICLLFLKFGSSFSFASPLINEFSSNTSPDWIEIYNSGSETIDLSQFRLRDLTVNNKLDLSGNLDPGGFIVFDWSNKLNNSGDIIKLVLISDESIIDQTSYGDQGGIPAPQDTQTVGRKEDGNSDWVLFNSSSSGGSNNSSEVYIPPTATNTPIPTPTNTPKPTKTPTPIKTPSKNAGSTTTTSTSKAVANTGLNSIKPTTPSPKITSSDKISNDPIKIARKKEVLGSKSEEAEEEAQSKNDTFGIWIYILSGLLFLGVGGSLVLYKYGKDNDYFKKIFDKYKR